MRDVEEPEPTELYPLGARRPELARTPSGLPASALTLTALRAGRIEATDVRATPDTLRLQAGVARSVGRTQLADNLARAAELTVVPDDVVLAVYTALRPGRSSAEALSALAARLETEYAAVETAALVREALAVYRDRGLLGRPPGDSAAA